jgi:hypothetical protein
MMRTESRWAVIAAFALVYLVWGTTYLAVALALHSIPPFLLMGGRSVVGGTALFVGARLAGSPPVSVADWGRATVCGILFFVTCHGFLACAQQHVPSGLASSSIQNGIVARRMAWSPPDEAAAYSGMELMTGGVVLLIASTLLGEPASFEPAAVSAAALGGWAYLTVAGCIEDSAGRWAAGVPSSPWSVTTRTSNVSRLGQPTPTNAVRAAPMSQGTRMKWVSIATIFIAA